MNRWERAVAFLWDHRWAAMAVLVVLTGLAAWQATRVRVDNSLEVWFLEDDPALASYRDFQRLFGNDEVLVVAYRSTDGVFDRDDFEVLQRASRALQGLDGVAEVLSVATVHDATVGPDGARLGLLVPDPLPSDPELHRLRDRILADPVLSGVLVDRAGRSAIIAVRMSVLEDIDAQREAILERIEAALTSVGVPYHRAGVGLIYAALNRLATRDSTVFIVGSYAVIFLLLGAFFRRPLPVVVALGVVGVAMVWLMGLYGAAGRSINQVTMVLPTLVLIIGVTDCVHILQHVSQLPDVGSRRERVVRGLGFMVRPCLFNTLTTAAGFASLSFSKMAVIRDLGLFAAAGLLCAFVVTVVVCTWALAWARVEPVALRGGVLQRAVTWVSELGIRHPRKVLCVTGALAIVAAVGTSKIVVDTDSMGFLRDDHPVRTDSDAIEAHFGPYAPLEFLVRSEDGVLRPEVLQALDRWQRDVEQLPQIGWSHSLVDGVKRLEQVLAGGDPAAFRIPDRAERLEEMRPIVTEMQAHLLTVLREPDALRVTLGIRMTSAGEIGKTIDAVLAKAKLPEGVEATPAGYLPLYVRMMGYIVESQVSSFGTAFVFVFGLIALLFRSWRLAALAIPANVLPVALILGVMGIIGVWLNAATVTIAAIVLGLVVDDTVQLLFRLRHELEQRDDPRTALRATVRELGRPMAITTLVLALGFSVLGLAEIKSIASFGLLIALALVGAFIADLLVTPALVGLMRARRSEQVDERLQPPGLLPMAEGPAQAVVEGRR